MDDNVISNTNRNTRLAILVVVFTIVVVAVALITRAIYVASGRPSGNAEVGSTLPVTPQALPPINAISSEEVRQFLQDWKNAWERKDLYAYASFYDDQFIGRNYSSRSGYISMTREQWLKDKEQKFQGNSLLSINIGAPAIKPENAGVSVVFSQSFRSSGYTDQGQKTLHLRRTSSGLKIVSEDFVPRRATP